MEILGVRGIPYFEFRKKTDVQEKLKIKMGIWGFRDVPYFEFCSGENRSSENPQPKMNILYFLGHQDPIFQAGFSARAEVWGRPENRKCKFWIFAESGIPHFDFTWRNRSSGNQTSL